MRSTKPTKLLLLVIDGVLVLWCLGLIIFGAIRTQETLGLVCLGIGILGLIVIGATLPLALMMASGSEDREAEKSAHGSSLPSKSEMLLAQIHENSMLSDLAKRVLFRDRELQMLRRAIEDDIANGDYNSGLALCDDMGNLFGHREEAEAFRTRILQAGQTSFDDKVHSAMQQFDLMLLNRDWAGAHGEAASIRRRFPAHPLVLDIDQRINIAREQHKRELESQFLQAAHHDDLGNAMVLLKELDRYLTREEAGRLAEVAQDVVMKHRDALSTQFKIAVNDHRWAEAAQIGDVLIAEYPNTKMADEVRSMIDMLRVRATQAAVTAGS
jgi:hypothetical protein